MSGDSAPLSVSEVHPSVLDLTGNWWCPALGGSPLLGRLVESIPSRSCLPFPSLPVPSQLLKIPLPPAASFHHDSTHPTTSLNNPDKSYLFHAHPARSCSTSTDFLSSSTSHTDIVNEQLLVFANHPVSTHRQTPVTPLLPASNYTHIQPLTTTSFYITLVALAPSTQLTSNPSTPIIQVTGRGPTLIQHDGINLQGRHSRRSGTLGPARYSIDRQRHRSEH